MKLYLVRHGNALAPDQDPESPLSEKGIRETKKMATVLAHFNLELGAVWHSTKQRARQTAEILHVGTPIEKEGLKPNDPVEPISPSG